METVGFHEVFSNMHHIDATVYNPTYTQQKQLYLGFERHHTHK